MRVPRYVPESPELLWDRFWEETSRLSQRIEDTEGEDLDRFKDCSFRDVRLGVPESYSHAYDAKVAA